MMRNIHNFFLTVLIFSIFCNIGVNAGLSASFVGGSSIVTNVEAPPLWYGGNKHLPTNTTLTGIIAYYKHNVTGKIAILPTVIDGHINGYLEKKMVELEDQGAIGFIAETGLSKRPGNQMFPDNFQVVPDTTLEITVPCVAITYENFKLIYDAYQANTTANITVTFNLQDLNIFYHFYTLQRGDILYQALLGALCLIGFVICLYKFITVAYYNSLFELASYCLFLVTLSELTKLVNSAIDPFNHHAILSWFSALGFTLQNPLTLSAALLVTLYWQETLSKDVGLSLNTFLTKLRWPFFFCVFVLVAVEFGFSIPRALGSGITSVNSIIYLILTILLMIYYFVTAVRILRILRTKNQQSTRVNRSKILTIRIFISSFGFWVFIVAACAASVPSTTATPQGSVMVRVLGTIATFILNVTLAISFQAHRYGTSGKRNMSSTIRGPGEKDSSKVSNSLNSTKSSEHETTTTKNETEKKEEESSESDASSNIPDRNEVGVDSEEEDDDEGEEVDEVDSEAEEDDIESGKKSSEESSNKN